MRYQATLNEENQSAFASMFPAPRQRHIDAMALTEDQVKRIDCPVLLVHGREDEVIPVEQTSWKLAQLLPDAEFHMFSTCGHWTQIEKTNSFCTLVEYFFCKNRCFITEKKPRRRLPRAASWRDRPSVELKKKEMCSVKIRLGPWSFFVPGGSFYNQDIGN